MVQDLFRELMALPEVDAIALGGSRAGEMYDKKSDGNLEAAKHRFDVPYPAQLKKNIISRNMRLLHSSMPAYEGQIAKAVKRGDAVSINHRVAAFMESYFDIIFAVNELTHPGEKRLVQLCNQYCKKLPDNFEKNINRLFGDLFINRNAIAGDLECIVKELEKVVSGIMI